MAMNKDKAIKVLGVACTAVGFGITMIQKHIEDKKLKEIVAEQVQKQLENK